MIKLSKDRIVSFKGNVIPLKLISERDLSAEPIKWSGDPDMVLIKEFGDRPLGFRDGVLITLLEVGESLVTAELDGVCYTAQITAQEMMHSSSEDKFNYYIGDFHDHTCPINGFDEFSKRTEGLPKDYIYQVKDEGLLDFTAISDHSAALNVREFFENFILAEEVKDSLVVFPGCECDVTVMEKGRYDIDIKRSGEIVCINSDDYAECTSWDEFYGAVAKKPHPICIFAHPQIVGFSKKGVWDFAPEKNNTPEMLHAVKAVEMGDGSTRQSNLINEFIYSVALDNGFKVTTTCSSDSHGPQWGYHRFPGKTVIMAKERSREAFFDAINNNRMYGTESGNLKLCYTVNGTAAPATLDEAKEYTFKADVSYFHEDESTRPTKCLLISDGGKILAKAEGEDLSHVEFTVKSEDASYFYLRFSDSEGRRTWSPPVFTGRAPKKSPDFPITPIDKANLTARDEASGLDASLLLNDNPLDHWTSEKERAEIVIDMKRTEEISALGMHPRLVWRELISDWYGGTPPILAEFPIEFEIYASVDGTEYEMCECGIFRRFATEEIIRFKERKARFVKLKILSNARDFKGTHEFPDARIAIGELTIYKRADA